VANESKVRITYEREADKCRSDASQKFHCADRLPGSLRFAPDRRQSFERNKALSLASVASGSAFAYEVTFTVTILPLARN
jgi:hypothetical protein